MALARFSGFGGDDDFFALPRALGLIDPRFGSSLLTGTSGLPQVEAAPIKLDVYEKEDRFLVRADVPGVPKERVQLSVDGDLLNLAVENETGQEKTEEVQGMRIHRSERSSSYTRRTIRLPDSADTERITARVDNGVLDVDIPKKHLSQQRRRQINIQDTSGAGGPPGQMPGQQQQQQAHQGGGGGGQQQQQPQQQVL